jgi:hypothetical protein
MYWSFTSFTKFPVERRGRRDVWVEPEVDADVPALDLREKLRGVGEARGVPLERAGVRPVVPAGFEPEHVERDAVLAELVYLFQRLLRAVARRRAREEP